MIDRVRHNVAIPLDFLFAEKCRPFLRKWRLFFQPKSTSAMRKYNWSEDRGLTATVHAVEEFYIGAPHQPAPDCNSMILGQ